MNSLRARLSALDQRRIRWHCRRGLLELDLLLGRFLEQHLEHLDAHQIDTFEELLLIPDNELLDLVMGRRECEHLKLQALLRLIGEARLWAP